MQNINVRTLFLIACGLKLVLLAVSWGMHELYIFGVGLPILVMIGYCVLGYYSRDDQVSDEKFADSCYYLGFIFTIATILLILMDMERLNDGGLSDIAARFGAAMITTLLGVVARVLIIGFKKEGEDGVAQAEQTLIKAASRLAEDMALASDKFAQLTTQVGMAAEEVRSNLEANMRNMIDSYAAQSRDFLDELAHKYQQQLPNLSQSVEELAQAVDFTNENARQLQRDLATVSQSLQRQKDQLAGTDLTPLLQSIENGYRQFNQTVQGQNENQRTLAQALQQLNHGLNNSSEKILPLGSQLTNLQQQLSGLTEQLRANNNRNIPEKQSVEYTAQLTAIDQHIKDILALLQSLPSSIGDQEEKTKKGLISIFFPDEKKSSIFGDKK